MELTCWIEVLAFPEVVHEVQVVEAAVMGRQVRQRGLEMEVLLLLGKQGLAEATRLLLNQRRQSIEQ